MFLPSSFVLSGPTCCSTAPFPLQATGLDEAPFCAELKHAFRRWIVIELHARLGEDAGLEEAMWDRSALEVIEAAAARVLPPRRRPPVVVHARGQDGG